MRDEQTVVERMDARLMAWGAWRRAVEKGGGTSGAGFPVKNMLHQSWQPPTGDGGGGVMLGVGSDMAERRMDCCISMLSLKLRNAVVLAYLERATAAEHAERAGCSEATARARVKTARDQLVVLVERA